MAAARGGVRRRTGRSGLAERLARRGCDGDLVAAAAWGWSRVPAAPDGQRGDQRGDGEDGQQRGQHGSDHAAAGAVGPAAPAGGGSLMTGSDGSAGQTSMPNRRAERARWRAERSRRRRLTSIGSHGERLGPVDQRVEHLVVAGGRHVEQLADRLLLGARVLPPLPLEGEDLLVAVVELRHGIRRRSAGRRWRRPWHSLHGRWRGYW